MDQKPTVGRIVHYHHKDAKDKGQPYPAVITHVWGDSVVNLAVCADGSYPLPHGNMLVTSVQMGGPDRVDALGSCWSWPPRV